MSNAVDDVGKISGDRTARGENMRLRAIGATAGLVCGLVLLGASPAMAVGGTSVSLNGGARTTFVDDGDYYRVCDIEEDGYRAVGWIEVQQADGSWNRFAKIEASGVGVCSPNRNVDVLREAAPVRVVACTQNGASGTPFGCNRERYPG